ncbi:MAG: DUF29 domain-containing protein [Deltaproteobacteria bacterium]|nr:DUF29 domain-containing protein [Deltaproteobacteria bacterium]
MSGSQKNKVNKNPTRARRVTDTVHLTGDAAATTRRGERSNTTISIDADYWAWLHDQAAVLRGLSGELGLDCENLAEELEAMARKDRTSLRSHLQNLLSHLLKWHYQPTRRNSSWQRTIDESRDSIEDLFDESPSLRTVLTQVFAESKAYARAVRDALRETGPLPYPTQSPWTLEQVLNPNFPPDLHDPLLV